MSRDKEGNSFPSPEANIFGAIFKIAPAQLEPEAEAQRQKEVRDILDHLRHDQRFSLLKVVGHEESLSQVAEDLADIKKRRVSRGKVQEWKDQALGKIRTLPSIDNLTVFLPYGESHLGRSLWAVDYGYQLLTLLSPVDIRGLRLTDLPVSSETKAELEGQFQLQHRDYRKIRVVPFLRRDDRYSKITRADIKQSLVVLQKRG